jgi:hypothetical protein
MQLILPNLVAGLWVESPDGAPTSLFLQIDLRGAPDVAVAGGILGLPLVIYAFVLPHPEVVQAR